MIKDEGKEKCTVGKPSPVQRIDELFLLTNQGGLNHIDILTACIL